MSESAAELTAAATRAHDAWWAAVQKLLDAMDRREKVPAEAQDMISAYLLELDYLRLTASDGSS